MAHVTNAPTDLPQSEKGAFRQQTSDHDLERPASIDADGEVKQEGVQRVEAITTVWSKQMLITMFILLYLVNFVDALLQSIQGNLIAYVTSEFSQHGLLATTGIIANIIGGVCNLAIAKVIDIWGRCEGFIIMLLLVVVGIIMKATCVNVEMYAAAHTLYWTGHIGLQYVITIILADITSLKNRLILFGINTTPLICSTFAGPRIAELFQEHSSFRWAFGCFIIIEVVVCIPVMVIFILSKKKAVKQGVYPRRNTQRSAWESTKYYFVQFDTVGMFLTIAGFSLLLLPFSLAIHAPQGWKSGYIIAMIVLGVCCLAAFYVWEKFFAVVPYIPFKFLKNRTILGACLMYGFMFASIFAWDSFYYSYLQVVHQQSISNAGYILNTFSLTSSIIAPFVGVGVRILGTFKWPSIAVIPFAILGTALLIHFRTPSASVGYLVMCQIFSGIYSGVWALTGQLAIMASVNHQEIAVALALFSLFGGIGAAVGQAIAGGLWNNILPVKLAQFLPADAQDQAATIFGDITVQLGYEMGSPVRNAIIAAYADVERKMVITGVAILPMCFIFILMWKNINVKKLELEKGAQAKGRTW